MSGHRSGRRRGRRSDPGRVRPVAHGRDHRLAGLAVDGGGAFAQRRDQQTAADLAALAAANDYLINNDSDQADDPSPRPSPPTNGFTDGIGGDGRRRSRSTPSNGVEVHGRHRRAAPEHASWARSACRAGRSPRAPTSLAGFPDSAGGRRAVHLLDRGVRQRRHAEVPDGHRLRRDATATSRSSDLDFAWTNYGTGNVNTSEVARHHRRHHDDQQDARPTASTSASTTTATTRPSTATWTPT